MVHLMSLEYLLYAIIIIAALIFIQYRESRLILIEKFKFIRRFKDKKKQILIERFITNQAYINNDTVLCDIGVGRGVDIPKYLKAGIKTIIAIEPDFLAWPALERRSYNNGLDVNDGEKIKKGYLNLIRNQIENTSPLPAKSISCSFFSLEYFCNALPTLIQKIKHCDVFMGCVIDTKQVKMLGITTNEIFSIITNNVSNVSNNVTNNCIDLNEINMQISLMNGDMPEYKNILFPWEEFVRQMHVAGFDLKYEDHWNLDNLEELSNKGTIYNFKYIDKHLKQYCALYKSFMFKKFNKKHPRSRIDDG